MVNLSSALISCFLDRHLYYFLFLPFSYYFFSPINLDANSSQGIHNCNMKIKYVIEESNGLTKYHPRSEQKITCGFILILYF